MGRINTHKAPSAVINGCLMVLTVVSLNQSVYCGILILTITSGRQVWNKDIPWQPVPIHTIESDDVLLRPSSVPCPRLKQMWKEKESDAEYVKMWAGHKQLLRELSEYSGMEVTPQNIYKITGMILLTF